MTKPPRDFTAVAQEIERAVATTAAAVRAHGEANARQLEVWGAAQVAMLRRQQPASWELTPETVEAQRQDILTEVAVGQAAMVLAAAKLQADRAISRLLDEELEAWTPPPRAATCGAVPGAQVEFFADPAKLNDAISVPWKITT